MGADAMLPLLCWALQLLLAQQLLRCMRLPVGWLPPVC